MEASAPVRRSAWPFLAGGLGALLWVQTAFGAIALALWAEPAVGHTLVALGAAVSLTVALWRRSSVGLLAVFPVSLLAVLHTMPDAVAVSSTSAYRWVPWSATLLLYVMAASIWLSRPGEESFDTMRAPVEGTPVGTAPGPATAGRIAAAIAFLLVPSAALVLRAPEAHFAPQGAPAYLLAHLALVFAFCIATYVFAMAPMLDMRADQARLRARAEAPTSPRRRRLERAGWLALTVAIAALFALLAVRS